MKRYILPALAALTLVSAGSFAERKLVVTDINGNKTEFNAADINGVIFENAPEYIEATCVPYTRYEEKNGLGLYTVELATAADEYGMPLELGDIMLSLELTGPTTADLEAPELAPGYYMPGNGKQPFTFDVTKSVVYTRYEDGVEGMTPTPMLDGTIDVRCENGVYDIRVEVSSLGGPIYMQYVGEVPFSRGIGETGSFDEDIYLNFMGAQGRFYGNWYYPFAADLTTDFFTGNIRDGVLTSGYVLHIDFCEPKPEDCMAADQRVADGKYSVETREEVVGSMYLPFRFNPGAMVDFMGTEYTTGTRLEYFDETGHRKLAMITDGTFSVEGDGAFFSFNLIAENGIKIEGSYRGIPAINNYCDNDVKEPLRPFSTLTEDISTLKWNENTFAYSYCEDNPEIIDGMYNMYFSISDIYGEGGDYLQFNIISEVPYMEERTYTVNSTLQPNTMIPGTVDFSGTPIFSWFGDLDSTDEEGYQTILAPIASGTVTVTALEEGEYKFVIDLVDDNGYSIKGEYTGLYFDLDGMTPYSESKVSKTAPRQMKKMAKRSLKAITRR